MNWGVLSPSVTSIVTRPLPVFVPSVAATLRVKEGAFSKSIAPASATASRPAASMAKACPVFPPRIENPVGVSWVAATVPTRVPPQGRGCDEAEG